MDKKDQKKSDPKKVDMEKTEDPKKEVEQEFVTKADLDERFDAFMDRMEGIMVHVKTNTINTGDMHMQHEKTVHHTELGKDMGGIEPVNEMDIINGVIELEAFMEQKLLINVPKSQVKSDEWHAVPTCNGKTMPVERGIHNQWVKRKYVEILARCRTTNFEQVVDRTNPEIFDMRPAPSLRFPFSVLQDPHPHGGKWLEKILAEAA